MNARYVLFAGWMIGMRECYGIILIIEWIEIFILYLEG